MNKLPPFGLDSETSSSDSDEIREEQYPQRLLNSVHLSVFINTPTDSYVHQN